MSHLGNMILLAGVANKYSRVGIWQCLTCAYLSTVILSLQIRIASSDFNIGTIDADQTDMPLPRLCLHSGVDQAHRLLYFPLDMEHFSICKTLALHLEAFAPFTAPETALGNRPMDQPAHSHCSRDVLLPSSVLIQMASHVLQDWVPTQALHVLD